MNPQLIGQLQRAVKLIGLLIAIRSPKVHSLRAAKTAVLTARGRIGRSPEIVIGRAAQLT